MANEKAQQNLQNEPRKNSLPNFFLSVRLKYVKLGYHYLISNALYLLLVPLLVVLLTHLSTLTVDDVFQLWDDLRFNLVTLLLCFVSLVFTATIFLMSRPRKVYLVNFACYKAAPSNMCSGGRFMKLSTESGLFTEENLSFQKKILERSGIGPKGYGPKPLMDNPVENQNMAEAWKETREVIVGAIDELLDKTGVRPRDIGILVVNSSLFNPTPSLSAMVVNRYKLRSNILSYNLGGMGCSAGLISIDLAKALLQVYFCYFPSLLPFFFFFLILSRALKFVFNSLIGKLYLSAFIY